LLADRVKVEYKPPFIPAKLVIDNQGNVAIEGEASLVTPVGEFSIGAEYELKREEDSLLVIIRDRKKDASGFDQFTVFAAAKMSSLP